MLRYILRRLLLIPPALLVVNFLTFLYARTAQRIQLANNPFLAITESDQPIWPDYLDYLGRLAAFDFGTMPNSEETLLSVIGRTGMASLGLLVIAFSASVIAGVLLGTAATRTDPPGVRGWLSIWSTVGQAMPSFYAGSLLIVGSLFYALWRGPGTKPPLPLQGFGWDIHLVMPVLALMARPAVQIAQLMAGLLSGELGKQYVKAHRSMGHVWRTIRWRLALRNVMAPVVLMIAQSLRLLIAELVLVEWLFNWPGLGRLLASTLVPNANVSGAAATTGALFLNPEILTMVVVVIAGIFLLVDLIASLIIQQLDPRLRVVESV